MLREEIEKTLNSFGERVEKCTLEGIPMGAERYCKFVEHIEALFNSNLQEEREEQKKEDDKHFMEFWDEKNQIDETEAEIFMKGYKWGYSDCKKGRKPIPHDTRNGYCCACGYDIAGFEAKLSKKRNSK